MVDELLVRLYNVGLGDCIYVRVPDGSESARHILIDCGNKFSGADVLHEAIEDLKQQLPSAGPDTPDKKRLDLLVATHSHEDHIRGFDMELFGDIQIDNIWLSAAMDENHPQAERARALDEFAFSALAEIHRSPLSPALGELAASLLSLSKREGLETLLRKLPEANGIDPLYAHAATPDEDLRIFDDPETRFKVLAPMADIDGYYLGRDFDPLDQYLKFSEALEASVTDEEPSRADPVPQNISPEDFRRLRLRLLNNPLAFVLEQGHLVNNTSIVLLLEWRGRRLLFTGDAEVKTAHSGEFMEGTSNGSWNVMWKEQREHLDKPLDFLKVGHHGSENASPWTQRKIIEGSGSERRELAHPINQMLDAMLPVPSDCEQGGSAVVSTERSGYPSIPSASLMEELGRRVTNKRRYEEPEIDGHCVPPLVDQPQRTDLEHQTSAHEEPYVEVRLAPAPGWSGAARFTKPRRREAHEAGKGI